MYQLMWPMWRGLTCWFQVGRSICQVDQVLGCYCNALGTIRRLGSFQLGISSHISCPQSLALMLEGIEVLVLCSGWFVKLTSLSRISWRTRDVAGISILFLAHHLDRESHRVVFLYLTLWLWTRVLFSFAGFACLPTYAINAQSRHNCTS